ncbi:MAG: tetratricopeptide repeat protein [Bacteroidales bacterium]|nr:tetratricopeptide repeat protein [Bacteroidales bacterium]
MKRLLIILAAVLFTLDVCAQNPKNDNLSRKDKRTRHVELRNGNKNLKKGNYSSAINNYRKSLQADNSNAKAQYNTGIAHWKLKQADSALAQYAKVCENSNATDEQLEKAHYNAGNIHLHNALQARDKGQYDSKSLQAAIEEYKAALRLNSNNRNAQHNLSIAKQLLRPQEQNSNSQQNQQNQNQQNQDQQDKQNQDQQNQDKQNQQNQNNQNQKNQDQQNKDQQNQDKQNQKGDNKDQKSEQHRREAEQMLNAMKNNEQKTMQSVRMKEMAKEKRKGNPARIEKDW